MPTNPFVFGSVVSGESFTDRKKEIDEIVRDLTSGTNMLIFSPRRFGKTSLVLEVLSRLSKQGYITIYMDLFLTPSKARFAEIFSERVAKAVGGKLNEIATLLKKYIPAFKIGIKGEEGPTIELEVTGRKRNIDSILEAIYDLPQDIAKKKKKRAVVVFDEFQEILELNGESIEKGLRAKIQHHNLVSYIFMGSRKHLISKIFVDQNRPLYKIGKPLHLGKIPTEEFASFIRKRFNSTSIDISDGVIKEILDITKSHPYYTQQLCHEIWNLCITKGKVEASEIPSAINQVLANQSYTYTSILEGLKGRQKQLIIAIAKEENPQIFSQDFISRYELGSASSVQIATTYLEEKGIIERVDSTYEISDAFLKQWIIARV